MSDESAASALAPEQSRKWPESPPPAIVLAAHDEFKLLLASFCRWTGATGLERYPGMGRAREEHLVRLSRCLHSIARTFWRWHQATGLPASGELVEALERTDFLEIASRLAPSVDAATTELSRGKREPGEVLTLEALFDDFLPTMDAVLALTQGRSRSGKAIERTMVRCGAFYDSLSDFERLAAGDLSAAADVVNHLTLERNLDAVRRGWPLPIVHPLVDDMNDEWFGPEARRDDDSPEVDDLSRVILRVLLPAGSTVRAVHIVATVSTFARHVKALPESQSLIERRLRHLVRVGLVRKGKLPGRVLTARGAAFARSRQLEPLATTSDTHRL